MAICRTRWPCSIGRAGPAGPKGRSGVRRVVRWLKCARAPEISREDVWREALCQGSVDAQGDRSEVLARLEAGRASRLEVAVTEPTRRGLRRRRWR